MPEDWRASDVTVDVYAQADEGDDFVVVLGAQQDGEHPGRLVIIRGPLRNLHHIGRVIQERTSATAERYGYVIPEQAREPEPTTADEG